MKTRASLATGFTAAGLAFAILLIPPMAFSQEASAELTAPQVFDLADARRASGAIDDAIALYDALSNDPESDVRAEARYRKGLMLADAGRYDEAAIAFRALLDEKPGAVAARLELARMLAALGRETDARRELRQAQAAGIPVEAAPLVEQFAAALRSPQRVGGSFELNLAPDTNINRATQARTLDTIVAPLTLSDDARAQSGLGVRTAGQVYGRIGISDRLSFVPRLSAVANLYGDERFSDVSASALVGLEWRNASDRISASFGQTYRWFAGDPYGQTDVLSVDWVHPLTNRSQLVVSASAGDATYEQNPLQDGGLYDASVSYERALSSRSGVTLTGSATRQAAADRGYATWSGGGAAGAWLEMRWGTVFTSIGARRTEADERLFLFPDRRKEWLMTARAGMTFRRIVFAGLSPTVRLNVEDNGSSVGIYDYRRLAMEFGVARAF
ncbi:surface lipoprotein assembly modifier [Caulobacter sp. LARHSG274]